jgi:antitoxin component YwqK of YwqJK toxin-antitoxin module
MLKSTALSLALILLTTVVTAQRVKTDRDSAGLIGPVKSVQSKSVDYQGDKIVGEGFMKIDGDKVTYDRDGREVDRKPVSDYGADMGRISKVFDERGLLTESTWVDPKGAVIKKNVLTYLADGRLSQSLTYNGDGVLVVKTITSYDGQGRIDAETYYDPLKLAAKTIHKYDDRNDLIEVAFFLADGRKATAPVGPCLGAHRVTFVYNDNRQIIAQAAFEDDGSKKKSYAWSYDEKGNVAKYVVENRGSTTTFVYKYEFDGRGNWIKRTATGTSLENGLTVFGKPGEPYVRTTLTTREITYY